MTFWTATSISCGGLLVDWRSDCALASPVRDARSANLEVPSGSPPRPSTAADERSLGTARLEAARERRSYNSRAKSQRLRHVLNDRLEAWPEPVRRNENHVKKPFRPLHREQHIAFSPAIRRFANKMSDQARLT